MNDETSRFDPQDIQANKGLCILSYLWLLFLVPMLVNKNSPFTKFHVNQGIVLFIFCIIISIISKIVTWIPIIGWMIGSVIWIVELILVIMGIVNAAQGEAKRLPIIGNIDLYK